MVFVCICNLRNLFKQFTLQFIDIVKYLLKFLFCFPNALSYYAHGMKLININIQEYFKCLCRKKKENHFDLWQTCFATYSNLYQSSNILLIKGDPTVYAIWVEWDGNILWVNYYTAFQSLTLWISHVISTPVI